MTYQRLTIDDLIDRAEISDTVHRYASGIDQREWDRFRAIFDERLKTDFSSFDMPVNEGPSDDFVAGVRDGLSGFDATQHTSSNHVITLKGDDAKCVSYMCALHYLVVDGERCAHAIGGYYTNLLRRTELGWRIYDCTLTVKWELGDRGLFGTAVQRWQHAKSGMGTE